MRDKKVMKGIGANAKSILFHDAVIFPKELSLCCDRKFAFAVSVHDVPAQIPTGSRKGTLRYRVALRIQQLIQNILCPGRRPCIIIF